MNIAVWVLQGFLAFWNITGGIYTAENHDKLKSASANDLPKAAWLVMGGLQIIFALLLVLPGVFGKFPQLTPIAATYLAIFALAGCALFSKYSGFPGLLWGVIPALLCAFVAYQRRNG